MIVVGENEMANEHPTTRRRFLGATAATFAAAAGLSSSGCANSMARTSGRAARGLVGDDTVILFQGDSITDAGRNRQRQDNPNDASAMGNGYASIIASYLLATRPNARLKFYNRGISGNKVFQLAERWDSDCLALKPDVISILIGVNDIWHTLDGNYDGTVEVYRRDYRALLERTRRELPEAKLVICEPFVLRCGAVTESWFPQFNRYRVAARRIALDFRAVFVPFQATFKKALGTAPPEYWAADGVHPTMAGAYQMCKAWLDNVLRAIPLAG